MEISSKRFVLLFFFFTTLLSFLSLSLADDLSNSSTSEPSCSNFVFHNGNNFAACVNLPVLNSFLHWNFDPSSRRLKLAYRHSHLTPSTWVAWGINPHSRGMIGTQALVAYQDSNGHMTVYPSSITSYRTMMRPESLSFEVSDLSATYSNQEIIIFATMRLPENTTRVNQLWQEGPILNGAPGMHKVSGANIQSMEALDHLSGQSAITIGDGAANPKITKKNIHGVLNTISWGMMMPLGAVIARYMKVSKSADPAWFFLHITCQTLAYIIGVAGFSTGLQLGGHSPGIQYTTHRMIGIFLFCLATLQVFALVLRPKKEHKYRFLWNIYHHSVGYTVFILSVINIFRGFDILKPEKIWGKAYMFYIFALAGIVAILEVYTWIKSNDTEKTQTTTDDLV